MTSSLADSLGIARDILIRYADLTVFILGTVGSLLNVILFSGRHLRSNSCCTYFLASSLSTIVLLCMGIIPLIYALYNSPNPLFSINGFCKVRGYISQWSSMSCRWLLVMACIDRCAACSTNTNIRNFFSVYRARRIAILIILVWMILPMHMPIYHNIIPPGNIGCVLSNTNIAVYHGIYTIIMGGALPPILMLICTAFIWKRLTIRNDRQITRQNSSRDQQVLFILLAQVFIFLISTIPFMANTLYSALTRDVENKSVDRRAIEQFAQAVTEMFVYIFPASSFYSNTLSSKTFRKYLRKIFKRVFSFFRQRQRRVIPLNTMRTNVRNEMLGMRIVGAIPPSTSQPINDIVNK